MSNHIKPSDIRAMLSQMETFSAAMHRDRILHNEQERYINGWRVAVRHDPRVLHPIWTVNHLHVVRGAVVEMVCITAVH